MNLADIRSFCLSLPGATEDVKWENDLAFCVGEKMFAVANLEPGPTALSFKCSEKVFRELAERPGVMPAPYLARYKWVALESLDTLAEKDLCSLVRNSYDLVFEKLPGSKKKELLQL